MDWVLAIGVVVLGVIGVSVGLGISRNVKRKQAAKVPAGEQAKLEAKRVNARVMVDRSLLGGPVAGKINAMTADLVLTDKRLVVATHQGRVLELMAGKGGSVKCTGPMRLVIEGTRPMAKGELKVRVEAVVDGADRWANQAREHLGTEHAVMGA